MFYSLLENGILIPGCLKIGSFAQTQWGMRRVIEHIWMSSIVLPDMPYGC